MKRIASTCSFALAAGALLMLSGEGLGQNTTQNRTLKEQLLGTWTFVSTSALLPDGRSVWGDNPKGQLIFTEAGRFSVQVMRSDLPIYASNNRMKAAPEELKATVEGTISLFGTYTIDEANRVIKLAPDGSSFPNWTGVRQERLILSLTSELLVYTNTAASRGGSTSVTWRRAR